MRMVNGKLRDWVKQMSAERGAVAFARGPRNPVNLRFQAFSFVFEKQRYYAFRTETNRNQFIRSYPGSSPCENPLND